jgi:ABC-type transport system involved in multi-copper enzyme maturation permease subunit
MTFNVNMLNAVKYLGGSILTLGIIIFLFGMFASSSGVITSIGIGTVMGAVFIFLMGVFFVATEEVLDKEKENMG